MISYEMLDISASLGARQVFFRQGSLHQGVRQAVQYASTLAAWHFTSSLGLQYISSSGFSTASWQFNVTR